MTTLSDLAKTIRSKNAGTDRITFDIIFNSKDAYKYVCAHDILTRKTVVELYGVPDSEITDFVQFSPANAIKFTLQRHTPSGSPGERDVFGCQQYAPLLDLPVPGYEAPDGADQR